MLAENYEIPHRQEKKQWILQVETLTMDWCLFVRSPKGLQKKLVRKWG